MSSAATMFCAVARRSVRQAFHISKVSPCLGSTRLSSYYTPAHEYVNVDGKIAAIGITDFAQSALGDIVYVDLPDVGDELEKGDSFGSVESVKAASDVYAPVSGTVVEINELLNDEPDLVNKSPQDKGWFIKIECDDSSELDDLMKPDAYKALCEKEAH